MIKSLLGVLLFLGFTRQTCNSNSPDAVLNNTSFLNKKGFVIIELFTSEGCSSCPPADKLISELAAKAESDSTDILILSEHVDYWNKIGWVDPYSSSFFSQRQRWYGEYFNEESIYTPQMVVNGTTTFVGSDHERATKAIDEALRATNLFRRISISSNEPKISSYNYEMDEVNNRNILNFVLVEKQTVSNVTRGENKGKVLSHTNVVRDWVTIENPSIKGNIEFKKLQSFNREKFSIIAFVQNKVNREIVSAGVLK